MIALKELPSFKNGAPEDTKVWVWNRGPLHQAWKDGHVERCYSVTGEDFVGLTFIATGWERVTPQTSTLQEAIRYLASQGQECRLVFVES